MVQRYCPGPTAYYGTTSSIFRWTHEASLSEDFMESFMTLNIINFADMARKEKNEVSWDVRRVSSP